jgi:hypothetical protein
MYHGSLISFACAATCIRAGYLRAAGLIFSRARSRPPLIGRSKLIIGANARKYVSARCTFPLTRIAKFRSNLCSMDVRRPVLQKPRFSGTVTLTPSGMQSLGNSRTFFSYPLRHFLSVLFYTVSYKSCVALAWRLGRFRAMRHWSVASFSRPIHRDTDCQPLLRRSKQVLMKTSSIEIFQFPTTRFICFMECLGHFILYIAHRYGPGRQCASERC